MREIRYRDISKRKKTDTNRERKIADTSFAVMTAMAVAADAVKKRKKSQQNIKKEITTEISEGMGMAAAGSRRCVSGGGWQDRLRVRQAQISFLIFSDLFFLDSGACGGAGGGVDDGWVGGEHGASRVEGVGCRV